MKNLLKNKNEIIMNSVNYQDANYNANHEARFELEASLELSNYKMSIANDLSKIKFDILGVVIAKNIETNCTIFTLCAAISVISYLKKGITEDKIKKTMFTGNNRLDVEAIDSFLRPHIGKEINEFLNFTNYRGNKIFLESNKI